MPTIEPHVRPPPRRPPLTDPPRATRPHSTVASPPAESRAELWDPQHLRDQLLEAIDLAEDFYRIEDRNVGTSLSNTLVSTVAELARTPVDILNLGTNTAKAWERIEHAQDGSDYALAVCYVLSDLGEAAGTLLAAGSLARLSAKQLTKLRSQLEALAGQARVSTGRQGSRMLQTMAKKAGLELKPGGSHLIVETAAGDKVTVIPHTLKGSGTARGIAAKIMAEVPKP